MSESLIDSAIHRAIHTPPKPVNTKGSRSKRSVLMPSVLWTTGQTLRISFMSQVADDVKSAIMDVARQWLLYANLEFEQVDDNDMSADIRISTDAHEKTNNSSLGRNALDWDGPSMVLGCPPGHEKFQRTVLHEFGHALGMDHEHQHPDANIPWNLDAIRAELMIRYARETDESPALTDEDDVYYLENTEEDQAEYNAAPDSYEDYLRAEVESIIQHDFLPQPPDDRITLRYDVKSIMHYDVERKYSLGNVEIFGGKQISEKDKQAISMAYPGRYDLDAN